MDPLKLRLRLRIVHLAAAGAVGFLVYAPSHATAGGYRLVVAAVIFPILALTGVGMWLGPRFLVRRRTR
jgi:hypothetical protein